MIFLHFKFDIFIMIFLLHKFDTFFMILINIHMGRDACTNAIVAVPFPHVEASSEKMNVCNGGLSRE